MNNIYFSYADTLTLSLERKLAIVERMLKYQEACIQKRKEAEERMISLQPLLNHAIQRMKELQTEVLYEIIMIMSLINTL